MLTLDLCLSIITIAFWISLTGATTYNTSFKGVTWDDDNWRITNTVLDQGHYQSRLSLANGYLGINVAAVGPFFEADIPVAGDNVNGWPLFNRRQTFSTISGFWDSQPTTNGTNFPWFNQYGGESVISGVPHWAGLLVLANGSVLNASVSAEQISGFTSILDIGSGLHRWQYTWTPEDEPSMDVVYSMFVHKLHVSMAVVQLKITPSRDANLTILDVLDGDCAVRTSFVDKHFEQRSPTIWSASKPLGLDDITAYVYSTLTADCDMFDRAQVTDKRFLGMNESSIAQSVRLSLLEGQTATIEKYVGAASSDAFGDPQAMAHSASIAAASIGFTMLLHSHRQEWESVMPADSVDDFSFPENGTLPNDENIVEQQILAVTNSFYLLQNTIGTNAVAAAPGFDKLYLNSIPVCGLGSDCYGGQIFWDADVWMASGLVLSHPQSTQQITNYRVAKYPQARENVKGAFASSQNRTRFTGGAVYPWTSALFGNCTGTGPCFDYEYHLNGDIGMLLFNYFVTSGDLRFWKDSLFPIHDDLAYFYGELVRYNRTSDTWYLKNATDPVR